MAWQSISVDANGAAPQLIDAIDIPVAGVGAKERVDVLTIRDWIVQHAPQHALIERAQAKTGCELRFQVRPRRRRDRSGGRLLCNTANDRRAVYLEKISQASR